MNSVQYFLLNKLGIRVVAHMANEPFLSRSRKLGVINKASSHDFIANDIAIINLFILYFYCSFVNLRFIVSAF